MSGLRGWFGRLRGTPAPPAASGTPEGIEVVQAAYVAEVARRVDTVAPWLLIGPSLLVDQYVELRRRGVTHVVDLRGDASDDVESLEALGFRWRQVPVAAAEAPTDEQLTDLIAWLDADADPNVDQALYLHGEAGLERTPTVAVALLMQHRLPLREAQRIVLAARPEAEPTAAQLAWLRALDGTRRGVLLDES